MNWIRRNWTDIAVIVVVFLALRETGWTYTEWWNEYDGTVFAFWVAWLLIGGPWFAKRKAIRSARKSWEEGIGINVAHALGIANEEVEYSYRRDGIVTISHRGKTMGTYTYQGE